MAGTEAVMLIKSDVSHTLALVVRCSPHSRDPNRSAAEETGQGYGTDSLGQRSAGGGGE